MGTLLENVISIFDDRVKSSKIVFYRNLMSGVSTFEYYFYGKKYLINVDYEKGVFLRLSCPNEDLLNFLKPFCVELMRNDSIPENILASYELKSDAFPELMFTVEWHKHPEIRKQMLFENNPDKLGYECINLRIYNDNNVKTLKRASNY